MPTPGDSDLEEHRRAAWEVLSTVAREHAPTTAEDLTKSNHAAVAEALLRLVDDTLADHHNLSEATSTARAATKQRAQALARECEAARRSSTGWDSQAWQETLIFCHMCDLHAHCPA